MNPSSSDRARARVRVGEMATSKEEIATKVSLRYLVPIVPEDSEERADLIEDLSQMWCVGLLTKPWGFKDEAMVKELFQAPPKEWKKKIWAFSDKWTAGHWKEMYGFAKDGEGLASRGDKFTTCKFLHAPHSKDGYSMSDYRNHRERRMLEFLVPVLSHDKGVRFIVTLGNTLFGSLSGERKVDWGLIIRDHVARMVGAFGKTKPSGISPFLSHLYHSHDCLSEEELTEYEV